MNKIIEIKGHITVNLKREISLDIAECLSKDGEKLATDYISLLENVFRSGLFFLKYIRKEFIEIGTIDDEIDKHTLYDESFITFRFTYKLDQNNKIKDFSLTEAEELSTFVDLDKWFYEVIMYVEGLYNKDISQIFPINLCKN